MSRAAKRVTWRSTNDARFPYAATVDGEAWQVRINEFPEEEFLYSLLVDGEITEGLMEWPAAWTRPEDIDDLFGAADDEDAADLADAEREARATGKEAFSYARLTELLGTEPPDDEPVMRRQYYVRYPQLRTLDELAAKLRELARWD